MSTIACFQPKIVRLGNKHIVILNPFAKPMNVGRRFVETVGYTETKDLLSLNSYDTEEREFEYFSPSYQYNCFEFMARPDAKEILGRIIENAIHINAKEARAHMARNNASGPIYNTDWSQFTISIDTLRQIHAQTAEMVVDSFK